MELVDFGCVLLNGEMGHWCLISKQAIDGHMPRLQPQTADANKCDKYRTPALGGISVHGCSEEGPCGILDGVVHIGQMYEAKLNVMSSNRGKKSRKLFATPMGWFA